MNSVERKLIEAGLRAGRARMLQKDKIWSRYSHDKVDIGQTLVKVIRTLNKAFPLRKAMRAFSIGSSNEPQFRILETAFPGGLYLLDLDDQALDIVRERILRQGTPHVKTICGDYNKFFLGREPARRFLGEKLGGIKVNFISLHHSLYYSRESDWAAVFSNLAREILSARAAIHAVLMGAESRNHFSTTWLYNHFAGKFCGCRNDQDLRLFSKELPGMPFFRQNQIFCSRHRVKFFVNDFAQFMAVVWMIMLYPDVHKYSLRQREEITCFIYRNFWRKRIPLIQEQDHLIIYRGIGFKGLS